MTWECPDLSAGEPSGSRPLEPDLIAAVPPAVSRRPPVTTHCVQFTHYSPSVSVPAEPQLAPCPWSESAAALSWSSPLPSSALSPSLSTVVGLSVYLSHCVVVVPPDEWMLN